MDPAYVSWLKPADIGLWYRRFILGEWCFAEGAVYDRSDDRTHVVDILPPMSDWLCVNVGYGTTNSLYALLLGLGVDGTPYVVAEWRWDSRQQGRQMTDREYSMALRDWLSTVRLPASNLLGPKPRFMVVGPSASSLKVQLFQDGWSPVTA